MKRMGFCAISLALGLALSGRVWAEPLVDYRVEAGDSCASIARKLYGDPRRYDLIHLNNELGKSPHHLVPGSILKLPPWGEQASGPDAVLSFVRNLVDTFTPAQARGKKDDRLKRGDRVATEEQSSAEVTFHDTSRLQLSSDTLVVILGDTGGRVVKGATADDTTLVTGNLRAFLAAQGSRGVATPSGRALLSSGESQLGVDEKKATRLAVYRGRSALRAQNKTVQVAEGFGSKAELGKAPTPPRPLPPAPVWVKPPPELVLEAGFTAEYRAPAAPPRQWHVQIAADERFNELAVDTRVDVSVTQLEARTLEPGRWYVRVSAIDDDRFEGPFASRTEVALAHAGLERLPSGEVRVTLSQPLYCAIDGGAFTLREAPFEVPASQASRLRCALAENRPPVDVALPAAPPPAPAPTTPEPAPEPTRPKTERPREPEAEPVRLSLGVAGVLRVAATGELGGGPLLDLEVMRPLHAGLWRGAVGGALRVGYEHYSGAHPLEAVHVSVPAIYRVRDAIVNPYVGLAPELVLYRARTSGLAEPHVVEGTRFGLAAFAGLEVRATGWLAPFVEAGYSHVFATAPSANPVSGAIVLFGLHLTH